MNLNPILVHELRAVLRTHRFLLAYWVSLTLLGLATIAFLARSADTTPTNLGWRAFLMLMTAQTYVILIVFPAFGCASIVGERDRKTFDLLITTGLSPRQILLGKLQASCSYLLLYLAATLPLAGVASMYSGIEIFEIIVGYALLALLGILINLIALFCSATSTSSGRAIACTYGLIVVLAVLLADVASLALRDPALVRHLLRTELGPDTQLYSYLFLFLTGYGALIALFYLATLNRLQPPSVNPSTRLRVLHLGLVIALPVVLMNIHMLYQPGTADQKLRAACGTMVAAAIYALGLILCFGTEDRVPHRRVREQIAALPPILKTFRSWLYPGGFTGPIYALLMTVLLLGIVNLFTATEFGFLSMQAPAGWGNPATAWPAFTMGLAAYLLAINALAHFLASFSIERRLRIGIILTFMLFTLLAPYFLQSIGLTTHWLRPLSPVLTARADWANLARIDLANASHRVLFMQLPTGSWIRISDIGRLLYVLLASLFVCLAPLKAWARMAPTSVTETPAR